MSVYSRVLVAVDLTQEAPQVLAAAVKIAGQQHATLYVTSAIRPLNYAYTGYESTSIGQAMANFEPEARASAQQALNKLCAPLDIPDEHISITFGRPAEMIKSQAQALEAELIVLGTHSRHGLGLLLGSTANGVLHGAPCDVLTIRIVTDQD